MINNDYLSTSELAKLLGISRIAVFHKIKKGQINAVRIGRNYAIPKKEYQTAIGEILTDKQKKFLSFAVDKVVKEYGETLRLLGNE